MKIAGVHIYGKTLTVAGAPYTMAGTSLRAMDTTLVKLETDRGTIGWGETCPLGTTYAPAHAAGARAALCEMIPGLIGTDLSPRAAHQRMNAALAGHSYAKAALDIAVHDALARCLGVPVATILGGALRETLPAYYAIGLEAPDEAARIAKARIGEGFGRLQMKVGGRSREEDIAAIRKVSEVARPAGVPLAVDANRGWQMRDALIVSAACRDLPLILEQPCDTLAEIRQIRGRLHHPVYLDESVTDLDTTLQILGEGLADGLGLKLTRMGGLAPMMAVRDLLAARNVPHTCDDSWGGGVIAAACLHLAATVVPGQLEGVWIAAPYLAERPRAGKGAVIREGHLTLPGGPGLGITPDETALGPPIASFP